jgi:hypothetical protein
MNTLLRLLTALLLTLSCSVAQHAVTVHVACNAQNMTDNEWTVDFDVEVTNPDGSTTPIHVHVDSPKSENAAAIADALAHKLRKKTGLPFSTAVTTNPKSSELNGRDLIMPDNVKIKKVKTRKRLDKDKPPGQQSWEESDDHVKIYDGPTQVNTAGSQPNKGNRRTS